MTFQLIPFPDAFPNKGKFYRWDKAWNKIGYADTPQYAGAQPIRYPEDATPMETCLGGYLLPEQTKGQNT